MWETQIVWLRLAQRYQPSLRGPRRGPIRVADPFKRCKPQWGAGEHGTARNVLPCACGRRGGPRPAPVLPPAGMGHGHGCCGTIYDADHQSGSDGGSGGNSNPVSRQFRPHYWVVTLDDLHEGRMVFWESLTGQQYNVSVDSHLRVAAQNVAASGDAHPGQHHPFREIFSLFRHDAFLLNIQRFSLLSSKALENKTVFTPVAAIFNLNDARSWLSSFQGCLGRFPAAPPGLGPVPSDARSFQANAIRCPRGEAGVAA